MLDEPSADATTASESTAEVNEKTDPEENQSTSLEDSLKEKAKVSEQSNSRKLPPAGKTKTTEKNTETGAKPKPPAPPSSSSPSLVKRLSAFSAEPHEEVLSRAQMPYSESFPVPDAEVGPHHFQRLKLIGHGGIGRVFLVLLKGHNKLYAMKVLTKEEMIQRNKVKRVMTEREILATVNHPFIVTMFASFQTMDRLCFVMEYCAGGEFFRVLQKQPKKRLKEDACRFYAAEVTLALEYLHHEGFIYRDLKPENILMRESGHIALTDFDLSKQAQPVAPRVIQQQVKFMDRLKGMKKKTDSKLTLLDIVDSEPTLPYQTISFVGTEEYIAPEVVKGANQTSAVDWWTLGILVYEMLTGTTPFKGSYADETFSNIVNTNIKWPDDVIVSTDCRQMVKKLLRREADKRLGAENGASDIKKQKWFANHINLNLIRNQTPPIRPHIRDPYDMSQYKPPKEQAEEETVVDDSDASHPFHNFTLRRDSEILNDSTETPGTSK
eukprot:CAMPEP_0184752596 /NCGR_PEP_ID=MMETSP0315-20130426/43660_1 /TAXON_ID=101924 /ORGANISM="Rhodosorus marinus, Strain UTEX LB 2760" /LENGTH=495 /DNA_ID=CAMNT_0027231935 /DNA_START=293 /DNA_END=1781 /DNA_ORIENTATION=-